MGCDYPISGWLSKVRNQNGNRQVVFSLSEGLADRPVTVRCGSCTGCRLDKSRDWAIRCMHEARLHEDNSFITLTYNDDHLPEDWSLDITHCQLLFKRLRKSLEPKRIKIFYCGEYGNDYGRPHYHAIVFGYNPRDRVFFKMRNGVRLDLSEDLSRMWGKGYVTVGDVTFESAAYVSRYVMKKVTGDMAEEHYIRINEDGEWWPIMPEFAKMSNGIGIEWLKKFGATDVYNDDTVIIRGKKMRPPKAYDEYWKLHFPEEFRKVKQRRVSRPREVEEYPARRRHVKEKCRELRLKRLPRNLERER